MELNIGLRVEKGDRGTTAGNSMHGSVKLTAEVAVSSVLALPFVGYNGIFLFLEGIILRDPLYGACSGQFMDNFTNM